MDEAREPTECEIAGFFDAAKFAEREKKSCRAIANEANRPMLIQTLSLVGFAVLQQRSCGKSRLWGI